MLSSPAEGLSLLGAYEDSDEEDVGDSQRATANPLNRSADIDSTLANFMAVSTVFWMHVLFSVLINALFTM